MMKTCLLILAAVLAVKAATTSPKPSSTAATTAGVGVTDSRIVGGVAVPICSYPYQLSFRAWNNHICGASIISATWALTASHCIITGAVNVTLRAGSSDRLTGGIIYQAKQIFKNPQYNPSTTDYDTALVQVTVPFNFSNPCIAKVALPALNASIVPVNGAANVSGWGYLVGGVTVLPTLLQAVNVTMVTDAACATFWNPSKTITPRMVCAGGTPKGGTGACNGDSGGPLVMAAPAPANCKILVGVVSWGSPCAKPNIPDVYARVASMRAWIKTTSGV